MTISRSNFDDSGDSGEKKDSGSDSLLTVIIAFFANLAVAIAKTVAAVMTGSASLVAESAHSWADTGNQVFLIIAERKGKKPPDSSHPTGYGRDAYVWSMFAAFGLFSVGSAVSIWHGISALFAPAEESSYLVGYIVLGLSFLFEGTSFIQSVRQGRARAAKLDRNTVEYVMNGPNPTLRAVFAEDASALIGITIAVVAMLAHQLTGVAAFDAIGSILVGILLGIVAIILIDRNRRFLVGETVTQAIRDDFLETMLKVPAIDSVSYLHIEYVGPGSVYLVAAVDLTGDDPESQLAERLRRTEVEIEKLEAVQEVILTPSAQGQEKLEIGKA